MTKKQNQTLASARAYWRLAAKAHKNGEYRQSEHYSKLAEQRFREYTRQQEYMKRVKGS